MKIQTFFALALCALTVSSADAQATAKTLIVARGNEDYPPNELHVNGKLTGLHVALVEAVAARLQVKVVWRELPWLRAQKCVETGECDAITFISPTPEREQWGLFLDGNILSKTEMRYLVHKSVVDKVRFNGNHVEFLTGKSLVAMAGFTYGPVLDKTSKYEVKSLQTLITLVADGRYDVGIVNADDFAGLRGKPNYDDVALVSPPALVGLSYIAFSKIGRGLPLAEKFQTAYADLKKSKDYAAILRNSRPAQ